MENQPVNSHKVSKLLNQISAGFVFWWVVMGALVVFAFPFFQGSFIKLFLYGAGAIGIALLAVIVLSFFRWRKFNLGRMPKFVMAIILIVVGFFGQIPVSAAIDSVFEITSSFGRPYRSSSCGGGQICPLKPVIYLYPETRTDVFVNVEPTKGISYSEPQITPTGWNVTANPDGTLVDANSSVWPYLFWEGNPWNIPIPKEGFVIAQDEVSSFFDEKLSFLGLNETEIKDFKEYWVPAMQDKPYFFVSFVSQPDFDVYAPLSITPTPDT